MLRKKRNRNYPEGITFLQYYKEGFTWTAILFKMVIGNPGMDMWQATKFITISA